MTQPSQTVYPAWTSNSKCHFPQWQREHGRSPYDHPLVQKRSAAASSAPCFGGVQPCDYPYQRYYELDPYDLPCPMLGPGSTLTNDTARYAQYAPTVQRTAHVPYLTPEQYMESYLYPNQREPGAGLYGPQDVSLAETNEISDDMNMFIGSEPPRRSKAAPEEIPVWKQMPENWRPGYTQPVESAKGPQTMDELWDRLTINPQDYQDYQCSGGGRWRSVQDRQPHNPVKGMINSDLRPPPKMTLSVNNLPEYGRSELMETMIAETTGYYPQTSTL
jgi:hypothetical protein